jgi:signal peptidase I
MLKTGGGFPADLAARRVAPQRFASDVTIGLSKMQTESAPLAAVPKQERRYRQAQSRSLVGEWAMTVLIMMFVSTSLAWSYVIPTGSMEDTLLVGDHIVVDKLAYAPAGAISKYFLPYEEPKRGDVFAFRYPADISQMFVKRVIGLPGDHLKIVNQQVYINGRKLREPYVYHKSGYVDPYRDNFPSAYTGMEIAPDTKRDALLRDMLQHHTVNGEVVVPPNSYFAMGDNRDNSLDSRYWGFVPRENIIGKPLLIYWSYNTSTDMLMPDSASGYSSHFLDVFTHFFTKTRWNRTFQLIRGYTYDNQNQ